VTRELAESLRRLWVIWLRWEFRALALLLPVVCLEMALVGTLLAHLPVYLGFAGALPISLAPSAWRFAAEVGV